MMEADSWPPQIFGKFKVAPLWQSLSILPVTSVPSWNFLILFLSIGQTESLNVRNCNGLHSHWSRSTLLPAGTFTGKSADVFLPLATHRQQTLIDCTSFVTGLQLAGTRGLTWSPFALSTHVWLYASSTFSCLGQQLKNHTLWGRTFLIAYIWE